MLNPHNEYTQAVRGTPYLHITISSIISSMPIQLLSTLFPISTKTITIPTIIRTKHDSEQLSHNADMIYYGVLCNLKRKNVQGHT